MRSRDIRADFALGGITATIVDLHEKGLIRKLLDVQSFDRNAAESLARNQTTLRSVPTSMPTGAQKAPPSIVWTSWY